MYISSNMLPLDTKKFLKGVLAEFLTQKTGHPFNDKNIWNKFQNYTR